MPSATVLENRLNTLYSQYESLRPDSSDADLEKFASLFSNNCTVFLKSMREAKDPDLNRQAIVSTLREMMKDQYLEKRKVVSQQINEQDSRVFLEMENRYNVHSKVLEDFPETLVATFDDEGLVDTFKLYSCRSHFVMMIQAATGEGPYSEEMMKNPHLH
ncbi:hypothetical protein N5P37_001760 [Trichoderma harzianum]|uniref:Uncharacterized protein n=2 Tax=Trichoderma TaxID=5543 RepID=A0A2T4AQ42_TRIHA|nr:hypothetical protein M431DRAFT_516315 [Trichoderma harzianum CBS 226.95]KAK0765821.1 hypothetical protein N5P37_001760 [Trichoderma harzianum]PTB59185.1 hypothetical protein M431DRAFT_516315 [Trichoderma harzianum CBS 226.95]